MHVLRLLPMNTLCAEIYLKVQAEMVEQVLNELVEIAAL